MPRFLRDPPQIHLLSVLHLLSRRRIVHTHTHTHTHIKSKNPVAAKFPVANDAPNNLDGDTTFALFCPEVLSIEKKRTKKEEEV